MKKNQENDYYYVDKTDLIQTLLKTEPAEITLFTRPRRRKDACDEYVGIFLDIRRENRDLFKGLGVAKDCKLCQGWMNQWPVIFLEF